MNVLERSALLWSVGTGVSRLFVARKHLLRHYGLLLGQVKFTRLAYYYSTAAFESRRGRAAYFWGCVVLSLRVSRTAHHPLSFSRHTRCFTRWYPSASQFGRRVYPSPPGYLRTYHPVPHGHRKCMSFEISCPWMLSFPSVSLALDPAPHTIYNRRIFLRLKLGPVSFLLKSRVPRTLE